MSEGLSQEDFRRLLATPRRTNPEESTFKEPTPKTPRHTGAIFAKPRSLKKSIFKKPFQKNKDEDPQDSNNTTHYRDRAAERRQQELEQQDEQEQADLDPKQLYEQSKSLGGDVERTHLVKGLDYALLRKIKSDLEKPPPQEEQAKEESEEESEEDQMDQDLDQVLDRFVRGESIATENNQTHENKPVFRSLMAKHIYEQIEHPQHKVDLFEPGRMAFVFELADEVGHYSDAFAIPTAVIRSKADIVAKSGWSEEHQAESNLVIEKITQVLSREQKPEKAKIIQQIMSEPIAMDQDMFMGDIFADAGRDYELDESSVQPTTTTNHNYFEGLEQDQDMTEASNENDDDDAVNALLSKATEQTTTETPKKRKFNHLQVDEDAADIDMFGLSASALPTSFDEHQTAYQSDDDDDENTETIPQMMDQGTNRNKKAQLTRWDFDTEEEWQRYKDTIEIHPKSAFQFGVKLSDGRRKNREKRKDMSEKQKLDRDYQQVKSLMSKKYGKTFDE